MATEPVWIDQLSVLTGRDLDDLMNMSYKTLLEMTKQIKQKAALRRAARNAKNEEFIRMTKKYFQPYEFLSQFWSESDIIYAVSLNCPTEDWVREIPVRKGQKCFYKNAEFLRQSYETLPRFTKKGERLAEGKRVLCDVYRVPNKYQGYYHGDVILDLLYHTYPELKEFEYDAHSFDGKEEKYEIYPKNHIYTPLVALLHQDIDAIRKRNEEHAASYNWGEYTVEKVKERLDGEIGQNYFSVIADLEPRDPKNSVY